MKQQKRLLGSQIELLDIKGREIIKFNKELMRLKKEGFERIYNMKIELGISPQNAKDWQMDSMAGRFIGPDIPEPEKDKKEEEIVEDEKEKDAVEDGKKEEAVEDEKG